MILEPTSELLKNIYWITLLAVIVSSVSGVLKAGFKQFDLFGVIIIVIATGLGGGSLHDMLMDRGVFWIHDQSFFIASIISAIAIFFSARFVEISPKHFWLLMQPVLQHSGSQEHWSLSWRVRQLWLSVLWVL